ncbi:hypothetical protein P4H65_22005 [Paenibacillus chitinolyticus]|uniref:hypothetical protein n=1 Tax=Paenibacillus chitinolyticus TaxID=79263 RepID=UPI002DBF0ED5|nr:hypothetical protein [Paenibacillus chitinolyticus]MEC0248482.1 hypothetical protein [Paenibacillus chitinolyticus]
MTVDNGRLSAAEAFSRGNEAPAGQNSYGLAAQARHRLRDYRAVQGGRQDAGPARAVGELSPHLGRVDLFCFWRGERGPDEPS